MNKNIELHNFQIDGIKLQSLVRHHKNIKWKNLIDHPTIRNNYCIKPELSPFSKNFKLYKKSNGQVIINCSIPYFLEGHNYLATPYEVLSQFKNTIKSIIGVNVDECRVLEYEFGAFENVTASSREFIKNVIGVTKLNLEKSNTHMKMFGNSSKGIHYKVYDAVNNSKRKKTFNLGKYPNDCLIKHELKFTKTDSLWGREIFNCGSVCETSLYDSHKLLLRSYRESLIFKEALKYKPLKSDTTHILFTCLKSLEYKFNQTLPKLLDDIIESVELSASQRSKRRKNILQLDKMYNQSVNR